MGTDEFWSFIEAARVDATEERPFDVALVDLLVRRSKQDILEYEERFGELHGAIERWDVWAAAYLIGGGCSDDGFMDFRAGLIVQGREWYKRAAAAPDSLAEHPQAVTAAAGAQDQALFCETVNYAAACAYGRITGNDDDFHEAWERYGEAGAASERDAADMGEAFDFDDPQEMRRRLPRLSALYLPEGDDKPSS
ncbi:hypothetical protein A6A08_09065 [Nocardiopsis sp. TSRI0078]|uniref:DUF4240 domain-containing protein n=1 Tax=unclassified Nocardiopsis TaxID=2649073 RepID=UPI00094040C8|nr:DUF4240 domain-containing protein [Nocardiopsis sp. TSRI0078]OKI15709.1 hypothetical protein A6A08_09065 [Nocardiopsis sp. TSRI0078]